MSTWTKQEIDTVARASEIRVAGRRQDGSARTLVTVWHVVVDGALYVRSVYGSEGQWYKGVIRHLEGFVSWGGRTHPVTYIPDRTRDPDIDDAYFAKYGRGAPSQHITSSVAKTTTLRIEPR
ncbi:DUF2255 family protein [Microbacterium sp. ProA8]|uniref:DUF2255 family protein n=1 Tax=Microbacterium chionoecetis TaxID=3153754 RepID=UPI0032669B8F